MKGICKFMELKIYTMNWEELVVFLQLPLCWIYYLEMSERCHSQMQLSGDFRELLQERLDKANLRFTL